MTLIVGWIACDQRRPCSAYMASDSRISDNLNSYDNSQKLFALKNTPDILGYCGETLFTYQILSRLVNICDDNRLLNSDMDYKERSKILFDEIVKAHTSYKINNAVIRIYHIGRNKSCDFESSQYSWNGKAWNSFEIGVNANTSARIFCDGSGALEYEKRFLIFKFGNNENTSRNYFHCFCDIMKDIKDTHTGGVPQLVGLYNGKKFNGMYHGVLVDGTGYYQALKVQEPFVLSDVRWYNERFEICNWETKMIQQGAMKQPISKRATP